MHLGDQEKLFAQHIFVKPVLLAYIVGTIRN